MLLVPPLGPLLLLLGAAATPWTAPLHLPQPLLPAPVVAAWQQLHYCWYRQSLQRSLQHHWHQPQPQVLLQLQPHQQPCHQMNRPQTH
jgi:hypothetical protein